MAGLSAAAPRTACDILVEISLHLIEQIVDTSVISVVEGGFGDGDYGGPPDYGGSYGYIIGLGSLVGCYVGAQVVVGWGLTTAEVGTITNVDPGVGTVTIASLQNVHSIGEQVLAPTFPTQAPTDPLWTQAEMLEYLARAQNEFLLRCPVLFAQFEDQLVTLGTQFQQAPANMIELERVAIQDGMVSFPIAAISRAAGVVTAITTAPTGFTPGLAIWIDGVIDSSFDSVSTKQVDLAAITGVSADGLTLTWAQAGADATSSAGTINQLLYPRLYETTQSQVGLRDPQWFYNQSAAVPTDWYEDRTGNYQWGLAPIPRGSYYVELLASIRAQATLGLLDPLIVPSLCCHFIKYKAMEYALSKDGEARSPSYAAYCRQRFDLGIIAVDRYLRGFVEPPTQSQ